MFFFPQDPPLPVLYDIKYAVVTQALKNKNKKRMKEIISMTKKERKKNFQSHVIDFGHGDWFDNGTSLRNFERVFREVKSEDILCVCLVFLFFSVFIYYR